MSPIVAGLLLASLFGCASDPIIKTETVRVEVPIAVPCAGPKPAEPAWDVPQITAGQNDYQVAQAYTSDRIRARDYINQILAAFAGCK